MKSRKFFLIALFSFFDLISFAQERTLDPGWQWARLTNTLHHSLSECMRTDFDNNIFSVFFYKDSISIEDTAFHHYDHSQDKCIAVIKRDTKGNFIKAVDIYSNPEGYLFSVYMEIDKESNVYVYGTFTDTLFVNGQLLIPEYLNEFPDLYLIKFNNDLEVIWTKTICNLYQDDCRGIAISEDNFVYLGAKDYSAIGNYIRKYDPDGEIIWQLGITTVPGGGGDIWNIEAGEDGFIYISGTAHKDLIIQGDTIKFPDNPGQVGAQFMIQVDQDGIHHNAFFSLYRNLVFSDLWYCADRQGNIFISGYSNDTLVLGNDTINITEDSVFTFIGKMDSLFNTIWYQGIKSSVGAYHIFQIELIEDSIAFAYQGQSRFVFMGVEYTFNAVGQAFSGLFSENGELVNLQITDASVGVQLYNFKVDNCKNLITDGLIRGMAHFGNDTLDGGNKNHFLAKNSRKLQLPLEMPADTSGCDSLKLFAPEGFSHYRWNGNLTGQNWFVVKSSGTVHLEAADGDCCWREAETEVTIWPSFEFSLGEDKTILKTDTLELYAPPGYESYLWSTGDTDSALSLPASQLLIGSNLIWLEIANGPCSAIDSIQVSVIDNSGLNELPGSTIQLIPNPAVTNINIITNSHELPERIILYNQHGIKLLDIRPGNSTVDISALMPGLYVAELIFQHEVITKKLIIQD